MANGTYLIKPSNIPYSTPLEVLSSFVMFIVRIYSTHIRFVILKNGEFKDSEKPKSRVSIINNVFVNVFLVHLSFGNDL